MLQLIERERRESDTVSIVYIVYTGSTYNKNTILYRLFTVREKNTDIFNCLQVVRV